MYGSVCVAFMTQRLPLPLLLLSFLVLLSPSYAQQCRLTRTLPATPDNPFPSPGPNPNNGTNTPPPGGNGTNTTTPVFQPFEYGQQTIRGVNLGGWLVLEPWITPTLFDNFNNTNVVDEYTLGQLLDHDVALQLLQNHWETWITEDDFIAINASGLTHVRIPVGYWSVPITPADTTYNTSVDPYVPGAWPYLLQALNWAKAHQVHVILDLHGAPGSQNGFDNSGQRTSNPVWGTTPSDVNRTLDIIQFMTNQVGGMVDVIELLNEPAGFNGNDWAETIRGYWQDGYQVVRSAGGNGIKIMIEDAFLGVSAWENFLTEPDAEGVIMDNHQYQIFNNAQLAYTQDEHINYSCSYKQTLSSYAQNNIWTVMGEWTIAITDCAQWLNGRGVGARWDGSISDGATPFGSCDGYTGSYSTFSSSYKTFLRQFWESQVDIGEAASGWIYWCWKVENADEWSYQKGLEGGWIPRDPTQRMYPSMCS